MQLEEFANPEFSPQETAQYFDLPMRDKDRWDLNATKQYLQSGIVSEKVRQLQYRPFDLRVYYDDDMIVARRNTRVLRHLWEGQNTALIVGRQGQATGSEIWDVLACTEWPADQNIFRRGGGTILSLYTYPDPDRLLDSYDYPAGPSDRRPNLNPAFVEDVASRLGLSFVSDGRGSIAAGDSPSPLVERGPGGEATFGPEDIFNYIYAVFHSPTYRARYAEFLRIDFPRVPLTSDAGLFRELVRLGGELVQYHLLKHPSLAQLITSFPIRGENEVASGYPSYAPPEGERGGRVHINAAQYFEGIDPEVWKFHVGGYQVLEKWLKDRRGRRLSYEDVRHYQRVVVALRVTIRLMDEIDAAIPSWPIQ